jgi:GNAT superfamily N-acetyltransferase
MSHRTEFLTAETEQGRRAIEEVMLHSYTADIDSVPAQWTYACTVDDVPVSFIVIDPGRQMEFPGGDVGYAFICDVATREDRRGEGHFRTIMEQAFSRLREAGIPAIVLHGRYQLYRRFGFDVFTHHCGIFATAELIERTLGTQVSEEAQELLTIENKYVREDLLLITEVKAETLVKCKAALQAAAALARERGKTRILFEHPPAPSYGSRYPIYPTPETPLTILARACGARVCIQGPDPEGGLIPDADWIKLLDAAKLLSNTLERLESKQSIPEGAISFDTDAGVATIESTGRGVKVSDAVKPGAELIRWPSSALVQLVTGYRTAQVLSLVHDAPLSAEGIALLDTLFPHRWRFSRNESWTYKS